MQTPDGIPSPTPTDPAIDSALAEPAALVERTIDDLGEASLLLLGEDQVSLDMLSSFLKKSGYTRQTTLHEPSRVLDIITQTPPHVILIDLDRAELHELDPLAAIRSRKDMRHTPVIVLSASSNDETRMRAIELGTDIYMLKPVNPRELLLRLRNALTLIFYQDQLAHYDPLTGLPNRALFLQRLEEALGKRASAHAQAALLHLNLDRFKQINEGLGHNIGDALLRAVAERLDSIVRAGDTVAISGSQQQGHSLSHLGSDEFSILSLRLRLPDEASIVARRILAAMSQPFMCAGRELYVTPSIGIAIYPDDGETAATLLKHASLTMDQAKKNGGNRYEFFSDKLNQRSLERLRMENALRTATERNELRLYYQPKVDLGSGRLTGVEALLRWISPDLGMVDPARFIPVAEQSGLILGIGLWALQTACRQARAWEQQGLAGLHVAVNLSWVQFRQEELIDVVGGVLRETGLAASALTLELTESGIMSDVESNIVTMRGLKDMGVDLSVDDFGTGFSSLSYLHRFPLDELKIDRSFIIGLSGGDKGVALVNGIIGLAKGLKLRTVAEGIETDDQFRQIAEMGCRMCQGYFFSRPVPAEQIPDLARKSWAAC